MEQNKTCVQNSWKI